MRLFYSAGSPYARIVRIALLETGLDGDATKVEVTRARLYSSAWVRALQPPESQHTKAIVARESARAIGVADALEISVANKGYSGRLNSAQIVLGAALGLIEPRLPVWEWRDGRPCLSAWFEAISARQSFRSTMPPAL